MKTFFFGIIFYFVIAIPTQLVLTTALGMDAREDRWLISGITLAIAVIAGAIWRLLAFFRSKRKNDSQTEA